MKLQAGAVEPEGVAVHPAQGGGTLSGVGIEVGGRGEARVVGPVVLVPAASQQPALPEGGPGGDTLLHLGQGSAVAETEPAQAATQTGWMSVGVDEASGGAGGRL